MIVNEDRLRLDDRARRIFPLGMIVGGAALALSLLLAAMMENGWDRFWRSYLYAFIVVLTICLGAYVFTIIQHATRAGWSVVIRRFMESIAANLTWIWILFIPIALAVVFEWTDMYHWVHPTGDDILEHKSPYLNKPFWLIRAVIYFIIWGLFARFFFRNSVAQDHSGDPELTSRMQWWAPVAGLTFALTQTFAAVDWVMSLEAHWFSTMYGVYFFAASCAGFLSTLIIVIYLTQRAGKAINEITLEHYQDLGKLMLAFGIVFWAYIAFSQFMLIWYANIPEETFWYLTRWVGGWKTVTLILLFGHFIVAFLLLVTKHTKRATAVLALIAVWVLLMHLVDVYWLIMPTAPSTQEWGALTSVDQFANLVESGEISVNDHFSLLDLTCLVGVAGLAVAMTARRLAAHALVPLKDPRLTESLAFENS